MRDLLSISNLTFTPAEPGRDRPGLMGWVSATVGGWKIDGLSVRRTREGRTIVTFPSRRDAAGRLHPIAQPIRAEDRKYIRAYILADLRSRGVIP